MMRPLFAVCMLSTALALTACGKSGEPAPAEGTPAANATKGPAPAPVQRAKLVNGAGQPTSQPTSQPTGKMPPGHPPMGNAAPASGMPAGHPPMGNTPAPGAAPAAGAGGAVAGTITLASGLENNIKPGSVLFVIVRRDAGDGNRGMLVAATKHQVTAKSFPFNFLVTSANVMMQGTQLTGAVRLEARIDQDGDAISKQPGDIVGELKSVVQVGVKDATFALDKTL